MGKKNNAGSFLLVVSQLGKVRISLPVAFTTLTGYVLSRGKFDIGLVLPVLGIFLLACGASALNQIQELHIDTRMNRTRNRPLPAGSITLKSAWLITLAFFISGSLVLGFGGGWISLAVGITTFIWYNGIYTPLKRVTAFAAVPGSMVGALPPLAGWVAGGGDLGDFRAWVLGLFFFIGQIPHFWLLLLKFGEQYENADLPSLTKILNSSQIKRLTFIWIAAMGVLAFAIPAFHLTDQYWTSIIIILFSVALVLYFSRLLFPLQEFRLGKSFVIINVYYLFIMLLLIADRVI